MIIKGDIMKWRSVSVETWRDIMEWNARLFPDKVALCEVATGKQWTFKEHNEVVNKLCNALYSLGLMKGDRVAVLAGDVIEYCQIAMIGKAGLVYVPINWRLTEQEAAYIINESEAKVLFIDEDHVNVVRSLKENIPGVKHIICINAAPGDMVSYKELINPASPEDPGVDVEESDILGLPYTSGTSALPKGVIWTHRNVLMIGKLQVRDPGFRHDDINLGVLPLFHVAMLSVQFPQYMIGTTQYIMRFDPSTVMETIQNYKITALEAVPTMVITMTEHNDRPKYNLSSLRILVYVGSPMSTEAIKRAWNAFGPILFQLYGATEGGGTILLAEHHERALSDPNKEHILRSAGKPMDGAEIRIVDDNGNDVPIGTMGEIWFAANGVVQGYWKKPKETAEAFTDGWFHTGDMGKMDKEGYVYILDRKKDIIISGAENISARDVENVIYTHPAVLECAVIGVPSEKWGEEVKAIIIPRQGMTVIPEEIIEYCQDRMAGFKRPKSAEVWEELPKNPSGKILKREIRERYWIGEMRRVN
jgi:acyl-CoA synthetase (AMP-forming)/AMP-acid ligase II